MSTSQPACLDLLVAGGHLGLVDVIQLERLGQREDVLLPVVADRGLAHHLSRGVAPHVARGSQDGRVAFAGHDGPDDAHPGRPGDVAHGMVELAWFETGSHVELGWRCQQLSARVVAPSGFQR